MTHINVKDVPGFAEACAVLQSNPHTLEGMTTEQVVAVVLAAATPFILSAGFADVADQVAALPGMERFADWLDVLSNHIRKAVQ